MEDAPLADLFAARRVPAQPPWRDFFDAAETLTEEASVSRALAGLPASALRAIADAAETGSPVLGEHAELLRALLLTDADGVPLPVAALSARAALPSSTDGSGELATTTAPALLPSDAAAESAAAERAFTSTAALGDILIQALHAPLARVGTGMLGAADRRRIADELHRPDDLDALLALGAVADLLGVEDRAWLPTAIGEDWLRRPTPTRWATVAARWRDSLPAGIRTGSGWSDPSTWDAAFPADSTWTERARALRVQAEVWGLVAADGSEPAWARALRAGDADSAVAAAEASLTAQLPAEVDRIYLQNDLTAIAPGPLESELDVRLRGMARRESHAQASTYRFTAESIGTAISEGETAASILRFLADISLTGVPQPLEYLVRHTADRHGLIRVGTDAAAPGLSPRTRVDSDSTTLDTLAVDQALRPLGLVRTPEGDALTSRAARDVVLWALVDARYPAVAVLSDGSVETLHRHRLAAAVAPGRAALDVYAPLIAALRGADTDDADSAWLGRELEAAVRARAYVEIDVAMPGGETRGFVLEATGMGGGRLRGRERGADVERTLPVSSIRSVRRVL